MVAQQSNAPASTTMATAAYLVQVAQAMTTFPPGLPQVQSVTQLNLPGARIRLYSAGWEYRTKWDAVAEVAQWAAAFDAPVYVALSSYGGNGSVAVEFVHDGVVFDVRASIGTAEAYRLGAVLGRALNPDKGLSLTASEVRSALTLVGGA